MPSKYQTVVYSPDSAVSANTNIDVSRDLLPSKMDVRGTNDPIVHAAHKAGASDTSATGTTVLDTTVLTSQGQGQPSGPSTGQITVTSGHQVALGDALNPYDLLVMTVEVRGGTNINQ